MKIETVKACAHPPMTRRNRVKDGHPVSGGAMFNGEYPQTQNGQPEGWPFCLQIKGELIQASCTQREHFQIHRRQSGVDHSQLLGCTIRKVDNAPFAYKVSTIRDFYHYGAMVNPVDHPNDASEREGWVAGGHGIHVVHRAACRDSSVKSPAIPRCSAVEPVLAQPAGYPWRQGSGCCTRRQRCNGRG